VIAIPPRLRQALRYAGYPAFALAVALSTLFATLPRDRIKDKLESTLSADPMSGTPGALGMEVSIGDLGLTLFTGAGLSGKNIVLRSRPVRTGEKPARYVIDDATVHVGLFGLLFNRPSYSFKAHLLSGTVRGALGLSPAEQDIDIDADGLVLTNLPALQDALGLPVQGTLSGKIDAVAPKSLAANLSGTVELAIDELVIGDGKAKLSVPGDPFLSQGVTFPKLRLGRLAGKVVMDKGHARLENIAAHSPDVDITLDGYIELRDPLSMSQLHGYLKFRPSEALLKREPTVALVTGAIAANAKRADGYYGFQLSGPLMAIFPLPNVNPPPGVVVKSGPDLPPTVPATAGLHLPPPPPASPPPAALPPPPPDPPPSEPPPEAPEPARESPREPTREAPREGGVTTPLTGRAILHELHPPPSDDSPAPPAGEAPQKSE
jgi:type II secretion system protein N